jgi:F0F1-type ATP synthase membrane subunit a
MRFGIWTLAIVVIAVWSLVAFAGHGLLDWTSDWAAANADKVSSVPEIVEWLSWGLRSLGNASEIIVLIVWALGSILIIGAAGLASRFFAGRKAKLSDMTQWRR